MDFGGGEWIIWIFIFVILGKFRDGVFKFREK